MFIESFRRYFAIYKSSQLQENFCDYCDYFLQNNFI
jgi:hypothetical protein